MMQHLILGMLLGSGLVFAFQEIQLQLFMRKQARLKRAQDDAIALLAPETHGYCRSWCHDSQAEHDADVSWSDEQIKSASDDEILARIGDLSRQAERVWPSTPDTKW